MYCHTAEDGPRGTGSQPYLIPVYASPIPSTDEPIEPFPNWMRAILHGPSAPYLNLLESAKTLDDWGVAADLARYRRCDEELMLIENKIRTLEVERVAMEYNRTIIAARLEAARATESLAFLEGLAPLLSHHRLEEVGTFDPDDQVARPACGPLRRGRR